VPAQVDVEQRDPDDRELGQPVGQRREPVQERRGLGKVLEGQLVDVVRQPRLPAEDAPAVVEGLGGVAVGQAARALVGDEEAEPDRELEAEVRPAARKVAATDCGDGAQAAPPVMSLPNEVQANVIPRGGIGIAEILTDFADGLQTPA